MAKRILIVDDDEMVRIALNELLKPEGYEIDPVGSPKEALNAGLRRRPGSLISVSGLLHPGKGGQRILARCIAGCQSPQRAVR